MRYIFLVAMVLCSLSCQQKNKVNSDEIKLVTNSENFDWLLGNWKRNNEKEGKQTFENWVKLNEHTYEGLGFTMKENDTIWKETIRLVKASDSWDFEVKGKGEIKPTIFKVTAIKDLSFICENEENEFPKKIEYSKIENKLIATVSGGDMEIPFEFSRIK